MKLRDRKAIFANDRAFPLYIRLADLFRKPVFKQMAAVLFLSLFSKALPSASADEASVKRQADASIPADRFTESDRSFWSFQPVAPQKPPQVKNPAWVKSPIDLFILGGLEDQGLTPSPPAQKQDLIRRLYFDLTGLPPSPKEIRSFVSDDTPDAYEQLVDRLLNSSHYGERQAQRWLDVIRYAETEGFEYDRDLPDGWRFRDYVINAFNKDLPYDEFIFQQLAGDEINPGDPEMQIASGFHRLGAVRRNAGNQEVSSSRNEVLTERTDIIGSAFLGLTIGCARCHDHKFDPISQKDYYEIQAYMASTYEHNAVIGDPEQAEVWKKETARTNREIRRLKEKLEEVQGDARGEIQNQIEAAESRVPSPPSMISTVTNKEPTAIHLLKRGDWNSKGEPVSPGGLDILSSITTPKLPPDTQNRRSALAKWLIHADHPLTARVMVNRIWASHFGHGIVKSANDFGKNGDRPSHPRLLDFLASEFVENGWRAKPLHRMILLSSTYRQSAHPPQSSAMIRKDPENRFLSRFSRRRLEAEEIRDAMLAASGRLNPKAGGRSVIVPVDQELINQLYKPDQWTVSKKEEDLYRRSIYLIAKRNLRLPFMEVFDQPTSQTSCAHRESSTHAPQALELLNGRTSNELAEAFAHRIVYDAGTESVDQIDRAYWLTAGRKPTDREQGLALEFLSTQPLKEFALALFNLNAFLYVN